MPLKRLLSSCRAGKCRVWELSAVSTAAGSCLCKPRGSPGCSLCCLVSRHCITAWHAWQQWAAANHAYLQCREAGMV